MSESIANFFFLLYADNFVSVNNFVANFLQRFSDDWLLEPFT